MVRRGQARLVQNCAALCSVAGFSLRRRAVGCWGGPILDEQSQFAASGGQPPIRRGQARLVQNCAALCSVAGFSLAASGGWLPGSAGFGRTKPICGKRRPTAGLAWAGSACAELCSIVQRGGFFLAASGGWLPERAGF